MPVYNAKAYINRSINSVLEQTLNDFELFLIDDGSSDGSGDICDSYALKDDRVHVVHQKNLGAAGARNVGIEWALNQASIQWISFIDSDDWIHKNHIEYLLKSAIESNTEISCCEFVRAKEFFTEQCNKMETETYSAEDFFCKKVIHSVVPWGKLYKKTLFENIRYPIGMIMEDEFTTYKVLFKAKEISFVQIPLYYYYYNESSVMLSRWSTKHLVAEQAYLEQIDFFKANGYQKAFEKTLEHYCRFIVRLMQNDEVPVDIKKTYSKKLRDFMKQYSHYFDFQRDKLFYEYAYPKRMALYWQAKKRLPFIR